MKAVAAAALALLVLGGSIGPALAEDDAGAYDQQDAAGFIKLNALRLRLLGQRDRG